jgi:hypothetical protein
MLSAKKLDINARFLKLKVVACLCGLDGQNLHLVTGVNPY